jgi:phenylacetic acid degradation operon negative regulatory protein
MRAFRISDTLVRTALSRLVSEGWFERWKVGRNSYYRLTTQGQGAFAQATQRIYADPPQTWHGSFDLLLLDNGQDRSTLRTELTAIGYGTLGPDLLIAAAASSDVRDGVLRLSAAPADVSTARRLAERAWPLESIEGRYRRFIDTYVGTLAALEGGARFGSLDALLVRILLIHDYRRAVLKDPLLPQELLPDPWAGAAARGLCGTIYKTLLPAAEAWIDSHAQNDQGPLPPVDRSFQERFAAVQPIKELKAG